MFTSKIYRSKRIQMRAFIIAEANFAVCKFNTTPYLNPTITSKNSHCQIVLKYVASCHTGRVIRVISKLWISRPRNLRNQRNLRKPYFFFFCKRRVNEIKEKNLTLCESSFLGIKEITLKEKLF